MRHKWEVDGPPAGWPGIKCQCGKKIRYDERVCSSWHIILAEDCPGPPKEKPRLPDIIPVWIAAESEAGGFIIDMRPAPPADNITLVQHINAIIDYLRAREEK